MAKAPDTGRKPPPGPGKPGPVKPAGGGPGPLRPSPGGPLGGKNNKK
ncbi:MAG: hypothetical protein AB7Q23_13320 [Hyphomonadaceae bacterium]